MKRSLSIADDLLLWGIIAVAAIFAIGFLGALISTALLAVRVIVIVVAIGVGLKLTRVLTSGIKRRELDR